MQKTKIVATIGPASRDPDTLRKLISAGMDVARLNFSHGDIETHHQNVERLRAAARAEGRPVGILVDLQGPKFRMGELAESGVMVKENQSVTLTTEPILGIDSSALPVQNDNFPQLVSAGDRILIDDGLIELKTIHTTDQQVHCQVKVGGTIHSKKGMNLPGVSTDLPSMTKKDKKDLSQAISWEIDWVALSFVRSAADIKTLKALIRENTDRHVPVMAKIEKPEALENLEEIIEAADGVMVARGDLGIEIPTEQVPMTQKRIIENCNEAGIPVVTATQMLDSMIRHPRPTRAEASDVANALLDGSDAVMLSGETSIGRYPVEVLQTMARIIGEVEHKQTEFPVRPFRLLEESVNLSIARAIARSAREAAQNLKAAAILAITASGYTARIVSRYRPQSPIIAITSDVHVQRSLTLNWGVTALLAQRTQNTDEMIENALQTVQDRGLVQPGDLVAITAGTAGSEPGTTNLLRIQII
jgi:pyruvate kinase